MKDNMDFKGMEYISKEELEDLKEQIIEIITNARNEGYVISEELGISKINEDGKLSYFEEGDEGKISIDMTSKGQGYLNQIEELAENFYLSDNDLRNIVKLAILENKRRAYLNLTDQDKNDIHNKIRTLIKEAEDKKIVLKSANDLFSYGKSGNDLFFKFGNLANLYGISFRTLEEIINMEINNDSDEFDFTNIGYKDENEINVISKKISLTKKKLESNVINKDVADNLSENEKDSSIESLIAKYDENHESELYKRKYERQLSIQEKNLIDKVDRLVEQIEKEKDSERKYLLKFKLDMLSCKLSEQIALHDIMEKYGTNELGLVVRNNTILEKVQNFFVSFTTERKVYVAKKQEIKTARNKYKEERNALISKYKDAQKLYGNLKFENVNRAGLFLGSLGSK